MNLLLASLFASIGINLLMFIPAFKKQTDKLTDISYALTFFVVGLYSLTMSNQSIGHYALFLMILLWSTRIGSYLLVRIHKMGKDKRFDEMRTKFWSFLKFWLLQGVTVWVVLLPSLLLFSKETVQWSELSWLGIAIFIAGLTIESLADYQKFVFKSNPDNKGKWIASGLWKYSRHPNYLGEILVWLGVYLFCFTSLSGVQQLIGALSPLFITGLLLFVSGIPLLEKKAQKKWGDKKEYQQYKKSTGVLVPKQFYIYLTALCSFLILDAIWLGWIAKDFYAFYLGSFLAPSVNFWAAGIFYAFFVLGILLFVILPSLKSDSLKTILLRGALFGAVCYATYDLTNQAVLPQWPVIVTVVDIIWGASISASTALIAYTVHKK